MRVAERHLVNLDEQNNIIIKLNRAQVMADSTLWDVGFMLQFPEVEVDRAGGIFTLPGKPYIIAQLRNDPKLLWSVQAKRFADSMMLEYLNEIDLQTRPRADVPILPQVAKTLLPFQTLAVDFALRIPRHILTLEAGLGKTLCAAYTTIARQIQGKSNRALVVGTIAAINEWQTELSDINGCTYHVIGRGEIDPQYVNHCPFTLVSYDQLLTHLKNGYVSKDQLHLFDTVIFDEPRRLINDNTRVYQFFSAVFADTPYVMLLNGDPIENRLRELYYQVEFTQKGFFGSWEEFALRHIGSSSKAQPSLALGEGILKQRLSTIMFRRNKADVAAELPPKIHKTIYVDLLATQKQLYAKYANALHNTENALANLTRLQQVCNDPWLIDGKREHDSPKIDALDDLVPAIIHWKQKAIIFSQYVGWVDYIQRRYAKHGVVIYTGKMTAKERARAEKQFMSDPETLFFVCTDAGFRALNLPCASYVIKMDNLWANMKQIEDRAHRITSTLPVTIIEILTNTPFERYKTSIVKSKEALQKQVIEDLPRLIAAHAIDLQLAA